MKRNSTPSARLAAWECLQEWEEQRDFADTIVEKCIRGKISGPDADLAVEIFYGVIRWRARLEFIVSESTFKLKERSLRCLLHCALYQLLFLTRVPAYAAVDEAVNLAPARAKKLVNAFLRGFERERSAWEARIAACQQDRPDVYFSHPEWLIEGWTQAFGDSRSRRLLDWNNSIPSVFVRVNALRTSPAKLAAQLAAHEPRPTAHPLVFEIRSPGRLFTSPAFLEGGFYVQDPSTLRAVEMLDPLAGEIILDACAAPGGKTTYIAQLMENRGRIVANDSNLVRLKRVEENRTRLGCSIIEIASEKHTAMFDRILLDVPCSNTGVLRRRVDLRWRIRREEITSLAKRQLELCLAHVPRLKPGGVLVYSTCSLEREENEALVEQLLKQSPRLQLKETWFSFPPESGMDGGFAAKLQLAAAIPRAMTS